MRRVVHGADGSRLTVAMPEQRRPASASGDSVAIDGVCLTATAIEAGARVRRHGRDACPHHAGALARATGSTSRPPCGPATCSAATLSRATSTPSPRLWRSARTASREVVRFRVPEGLERYLVEKGSVAVAGVSLTVSALADDGFEVWLIPHTREVTTLGTTRPRHPSSTSRWTSCEVRRAPPGPSGLNHGSQSSTVIPRMTDPSAAVQPNRGRARRHPGGQDRHHRRRRGPRERGRSRAWPRRTSRPSRSTSWPPRARADLPHADPGALR